MQHSRQYIWALIGKFIPQFVYLATTVVLARYLDPEDFGKIGVLAIIFTVAATLMDAGLGGSLVKEQNITPLDCSTISVFNITISHSIYFLLFIFAQNIEDFYAIDGLAPIVRTLSLVFVINSWGLVPHSLMVKRLQFQKFFYISIISVLAASIVSIGLAIYGVKVYALVAYQLVHAAVNLVMLIIYSKYHYSFKFSIASFKKLISFGLFTTFCVVIDTIYENLITALFGKYLGVKQAGYIYQAKRLEEVPSKSLTRTINSVAFPVLVKYQDNIEIFKKEAESIFKTMLVLLTPLLITLAIFAKPIIVLLFGDKWEESAPYLTLLMFAAVFIIMDTLIRNFIKSLGKAQELFIITLIKRSIGILIIIAFLLFSIKNILWGYIISSGVAYLINLIAYCKLTKDTITNNIFLSIKIIIPSIAIFLIAAFLQDYNSIVLTICVTIILLIIYYFLLAPYWGIDIKKQLKKLTHHNKTT